MVLRVSREDEKRGLDVAEHGIVLASSSEAERLRTRGFAQRLVRKLAARIRRGGRRRRGPRSPSLHHSGHVAIEFVEDVGHAANVSATVRKVATTLRQRALAAKRASAEAAVEVEVLAEQQQEEVAGSGAAGAAIVAVCSG